MGEDGRESSGSSSETEMELVLPRLARATLTCRYKLWLFLNADLHDSREQRLAIMYQSLMIFLVAACVLIATLETTHEFRHLQEDPVAQLVHAVSLSLFVVDFLLRVWSCVEAEKYRRLRPSRARVRYMLRPLILLDLFVIGCMSIAFVRQISGEKARGFNSAQLIRMLRVLTLFKVERSTNSFGLLFMVIANKRSELFATFFVAFVVVMIGATLMFYLEREAQPDKFTSIVSGMWWAIETLTTVGYGDIVPSTVQGKLLASIVATFGIGLFAIPAGILGQGFQEVLEASSPHSSRLELPKIATDEPGQVRDLKTEVLSLRAAIDVMQKDQLLMLDLIRNQSRALASNGAGHSTQGTSKDAVCDIA